MGSVRSHLTLTVPKSNTAHNVLLFPPLRAAGALPLSRRYSVTDVLRALRLTHHRLEHHPHHLRAMCIVPARMRGPIVVYGLASSYTFSDARYRRDGTVLSCCVRFVGQCSETIYCPAACRFQNGQGLPREPSASIEARLRCFLDLSTVFHELQLHESLKRISVGALPHTQLCHGGLMKLTT